MFWYIVICALMLYPMSLVRAGNLSNRKTQQVALLSACFILLLFMGLRHVSVGVDTQYYAHVFTQFSGIPLKNVFTAKTYATSSQTWSLDFEYGYRLYNKLLSYLSNKRQTITFCNSLFIIVLLYRVIRKYSSNYMLSIWLYITLGIFQTEMNVARNAIAILLVYLALDQVEKKRPVRYVLACLLAASFHKAAVLFIPVYWLVRAVRWKPRSMAAVILVSLAVGLVFPLIAPVLRSFLPYSITRYFVSTNSKLEAVVVGLFYLVLFLMVLYFMNRQQRQKVFSECSMGLTMFTLNLSCFGLSFGVGYAARAAALFGPYMLLFIPQMLQRIENPDKRRAVSAMVVLVCGCQYVLRMLINNIGGTLPYSFFW